MEIHPILIVLLSLFITFLISSYLTLLDRSRSILDEVRKIKTDLLVIKLDIHK